MSDAPRTCPDCGKPIPADAPGGGLCPACLLREGLATESSLGRTGASGARPAPPTPEQLAPLFPDLEILEMVGRGGMGTVYKARQKRLDRLVALKLLDTEAARGASFSDRFMREARTLARVSHPNIVSIHDFGEAEGLYYFLMEFVDGANLREVMLAGRLSPAEALAIVPQICDALQYAHDEGVVHRDVKPENILLDRKGRAKIADFGLAKMLQPEAPARTLTLTGQVMGTPAYMAPEQIEAPDRVDHRADIYSLGVVFYEMLTGELPLGRFMPPSSKVQVDVRLDQVVLRTLAKEPELRYQLASDVKADVESIGSDARPASAPVTGGAGPGVAAGPAAQAVATPQAAQPAGGADVEVEIRRPVLVTCVALYYLVGLGFFAILINLLIASQANLWGLNLPLLWTRNAGVQRAVNTVVVLPRYLDSSEAMLAFSGFAIAAGIGMLRMRNWGRRIAIWLAFFALPGIFPLGLAGAVLVLIYLFRRDVKRLFELSEGPASLDEREFRRLQRAFGPRIVARV